MSRKSGKKKQRPRKKAHRTHGGAGASVQEAHGARAVPGSEARAEAATHGVEAHEEYLKVPRNTSKIRFVLMIGLVVFLLIIFVIPSALFGVSNPDQEPVFLQWNDPVAGTIEVDSAEFVLFKRQVDTALRVHPFLAFFMDVNPQSFSDEDAARILVLDRMAREAGIRISDADLEAQLRTLIDQFFQGQPETFLAVEARLGGARYVEGAIRTCLGVVRYLDLLAAFGSVPNPEEIERLWRQDHVELAYDYVELDVEDFQAAAEAELPPDEGDGGLEAWFLDLPEARQRAFELPELRTVELLALRDVAADSGESLLAAFPAAEDVVPDEEARTYYDRVFFRRFRRPPEPEDSEEGADGDDAEQEKPAATPYLSFEEVKEVALVEAPIYFALQRWFDDLRRRVTEGAEVDLKAEAEQYGLSFERHESLDRTAFGAIEGAGPALSIMVFQTASGALSPSIQVQDDGFIVFRVTDVAPPSIPPFEEIRDDVAELWIEDRMPELALERLADIRAGFAELELQGDESDESSDVFGLEDEDRRRADEDTFRTVLGKAGYEPQRRPWLDKSGPAAEDPESEKKAHVFFAARRDWRDLEPDEVPAPKLDVSRKRAYLARLVGKREVPIQRMTPFQFQTYKNRSRGAAGQSIKDALSVEQLRKRFGLVLESDQEEAEETDGPEG